MPMKPIRPLVLGSIILLFILPWPAEGKVLRSDLSLQGYTGVLNVPNALLTDPGALESLFSDQLEPYRRHQDSVENYMFSIGFLPFLEVGGRFTEEHPDGIRDLSASAKVAVPLSRWYPHFPRIAFGIQDMGGGATFFQTTYAVVSKEIDPVRLSLGYGFGPDRLDGAFGGAEVRLFDWLYLLGDYDTEETHAGMRLTVPEQWFPVPMKLSLTAKTSLDHEPDQPDFALSFQIPLGFGSKNAMAEQAPKAGGMKTEDGETSGTPGASRAPGSRKNTGPTPVESEDKGKETLLALQRKLIQQGFENVRVGTLDGEVLVIEYENNRYNHNQLDGLGLAMGMGSRMAPGHLTRIRVVLKAVRIPILRMEAPIEACRSFMGIGREIALGSDRFAEKLSISTDGDLSEGASFVGGNSNDSRFKPRLFLYPGLRTFLGTELSALDYLVSLKAEARLQTWRGGVLSGRTDIPVFWSENFDSGEPFHRYREDPRLERVMFHQGFKPFPSVLNQVSAGMYQEDNYGAMNETFWTLGQGRHRFGLKLGYFDDTDTDEEREIYLGSYRYYLDAADLYLEGIYGKYWHQDRGVTAEVKRFFDDTAISFFYRHVGEDTGERAAGIRISLPLTPRRDMKPVHFQVRGSDRWSYEHQTTIADEGERNPINTDIAVIPRTTHELETVYSNDDRLGARYIRKHVERMREAYRRWGD